MLNPHNQRVWSFHFHDSPRFTFPPCSTAVLPGVLSWEIAPSRRRVGRQQDVLGFQIRVSHLADGDSRCLPIDMQLSDEKEMFQGNIRKPRKPCFFQASNKEVFHGLPNKMFPSTNCGCPQDGMAGPPKTRMSGKPQRNHWF